ncbi:hypothetical protein COCC4DRAFT_129358 [Bipolaris maydis ATCC 48331]|uniref:2',3'-cyclic-nucleotide 3'-phosphodiesterase n=2 Tax=Cochliobolus heterostrophus TaxID=5016 RepID=M2TZG2_COCH5|nr:uncharacterized protein COCC4DRAFT_129358 [Bipolaris maydis ATCC 48331]EMD91679.1 hypothetical protein COCHEDRAFT_1175876 [Bipolaris maydis C5]KAJ5027171.1 2',3'-cyclic-nucleotide 3'-phosphodiesterase [Bipolaris maydis]ENI08564.1 hypothetical protein COCC4DRAFT_129358 [Bipolaris maydis ATCC 48331]KAJ5059059.1 2',3'-cyclic-nucleotide 3'-phosphodiesterase [Bipolaris maydis]KAJ6202644.1 2',3'-cyclic-nucleotide 3'-phosphodiesterase [Bipolaris maydis]
MPGSSLWLLPPSNHPLGKVLPALIDKTSKQFGSPHRFLPHVTLTSEILPSTHGSDGQAWLDSLDLDVGKGEVRVNFKCLDSEDYFFRKLYIKCQVDDGLKKLAGQCRRHVEGFSDEKKAEQWANESYMPHLSLMYHDCPAIDAKGLSSVDMTEVELEGSSQMSGWVGGRVVLVPTDKPIDQWVPIAERLI